MRNPTICGKNRLAVPQNGCTDCAELEYRLKKLEDWQEVIEEEGYDALVNKPSINGVTVEGDKTSEEYLIMAIDTATLESLTPLECYVPPCQEPIVCQTTTCCGKVACGEEPIEPTCEDFGTPIWSGTGTATNPFQ